MRFSLRKNNEIPSTQSTTSLPSASPSLHPSAIHLPLSISTTDITGSSIVPQVESGGQSKSGPSVLSKAPPSSRSSGAYGTVVGGGSSLRRASNQVSRQNQPPPSSFSLGRSWSLARVRSLRGKERQVKEDASTLGNTFGVRVGALQRRRASQANSSLAHALETPVIGQ